MSIQKTNGIVFYTTAYGNTSVVAKIYTQKFGLQSYLVNSVRSSKAKNKNQFFQPLSLVSLVVYHKAGGGLQRISEVSFSHALTSLTQNMVKTAQALFITEVLYRCIKEEEANEALFEFIETSVLFLDNEEKNFINFHLLFLMKLSVHLGFKPMGMFSNEHGFFDLAEGVFQQRVPVHPNYISGEVAAFFGQLTATSLSELKNICITKKLRDELIDALLLYYNLHLPGGIKVQSHQVLKEILA